MLTLKGARQRYQSAQVTLIESEKTQVNQRRLDHLIDASVKLAQAGVGYDEISQHAVVHGIDFNDAIETLYRERCNA